MNNSKKIAIIALMSAFSIVLATVANFKLPFLSFFKPDFSDVPIFVLTFMFGGKYGIMSLFIVSIIRMLTGDSVNLPVFLLRLSSSIIIFFINIYKKYQKNFYLFVFIAIICHIIIRIPFSYCLWVITYNIAKETFIKQMWLNIILLTVTRSLLNIIISKLIFKNLPKNIIS